MKLGRAEELKLWLLDLLDAGRLAFRAAGESLTDALVRVNDRVRRLGQTTIRPVDDVGFTACIPGNRRVYAIGDIHGRADLLIRLLTRLNWEAESELGEFEGRPILVFLGDYIDRGFQSRDVIDVLLSDMLSPFETYFLKGNHEAAMIQFLSDPAIGPRWAEFGGAETLVSYGVKPPRQIDGLDEWRRASEELNQKLPEEHRHLLFNLELSVRIGDYVFVHAGLRPGAPLEAQREQDLLWIREEFLRDRSHFGAVIVHGHTPAPNPYRDARRIGVDTGAYLSGRLTAVKLQGEQVEFISTGPTLSRGQANA